MKPEISGRYNLFGNRVRLGIVSVLMVNESYDFMGLLDTLHITDGKLASHLKALEENDLIRVNKQFPGMKPNTTYSISGIGKKLFTEQLKSLEDIIKSK